MCRASACRPRRFTTRNGHNDSSKGEVGSSNATRDSRRSNIIFELRTSNFPLTIMSSATVITIGHTPDMDDAFMFYALAERKVTLNGLRIEHVIEDIQALSQRALKAELDVTAISAAPYPAVEQDYWILAVGSSVGQDYGP